MNLFFDEISQKLLIDAKKEMFDLKHPYVGSEHLLLAILHHADLEVTRTLNHYGITYEKFREELIRVVGIGSKSNDWFLFTPLLKRIINNATYYSKDSNCTVTPYSLLISILQEGDGVANRILLGMSIDLNALYDKFLSSETFMNAKVSSSFDEFGINMNECSLSGKYDPVIGREEQIDQLIRILLRKNKNNPLLIGEAGVGKTAIVEELVRRITSGNVPLKLKDKVIYSISMSQLVAGTKYRGEFEEKIHKLIDDVRDHPNVILFIDEVHTLMGAGGAEGAIDASNIVKPYLARGDIKIIGATTLSEYTKFISKDKALERRFQKIYVEEPTKEEVYTILKELVPLYEQYHDVILPNSFIEDLVDLSFSCVFSGRQPDKAIDLLDEVCSYASIHENQFDLILSKYDQKIKEVENLKNLEIRNHNFQKANDYKEQEMQLRSEYNTHLFQKKDSSVVVQRKDLCHVLCHKVRVPDHADLRRLVRSSSKILKETIFGQEKVIDKTLKILETYDYIENKKAMLFLFVGKSGVGKTFLVEKIAKNVFPNTNFVRLNMAEYRDESSLSKIIGTSPGYVGYYDDYLFQSIKENPFSVLLLDDISKGNSRVLSFLLKAFESGVITNSRGEQINLSKCLIFLTSSVPFSSLGFVSHTNSSDVDFFVDYTISFENLTEEVMTSYIDQKLKKYSFDTKKRKKLKNRILQNSSYETCGFHKIDSIFQKEIVVSP